LRSPTVFAAIRRLLTHKDVRATGSNALWLGSEKAIRVLVGLFVGLWVARYLGPEDYGQLQYAAAWVSLFGAIAWLGAGDAIVRDLVRDDSREARLMGAAFAIRFAGSFLAMIAAASICTLFFPADSTVTKLIWIICLTTPFAEIPGGIWIWFQARMEMRLPILTRSISIMLGGVLQIGLIMLHAPLTAFAWALVAEAAVLFVAIFAVYLLRGGSVTAWRFHAPTIKETLISGSPIILASLVGSLNTRLDKLMLAWLGGFQDVGIYHAVTRFSVVLWFFPNMLMKALAPKFIYPKDLGRRLPRNVAWISAALLAAAVIVAGSDLVGLLLTEQYLPGVPVLLIHVWAGIFVYLDCPATQYLLATNRQRMLIFKSLGALIVNISLNTVLIPGMGAVGAAWATLAAQAWAGCLFYIVHPDVRDVHLIQRAAVRQLLWDWWHPRVAPS
jgi:PST family polysaccharide transporter